MLRELFWKLFKLDDAIRFEFVDEFDTFRH